MNSLRDRIKDAYNDLELGRLSETGVILNIYTYLLFNDVVHIDSEENNIINDIRTIEKMIDYEKANFEKFKSYLYISEREYSENRIPLYKKYFPDEISNEYLRNYLQGVIDRGNYGWKDMGKILAAGKKIEGIVSGYRVVKMARWLLRIKYDKEK